MRRLARRTPFDCRGRATKNQYTAMHLRRYVLALVSAGVLVTLALPAAQPKPPISVDDLMKLRSIVDVQMAPDGTARRLRGVDAEPGPERT